MVVNNPCWSGSESSWGPEHLSSVKPLLHGDRPVVSFPVAHLAMTQLTLRWAWQAEENTCYVPGISCFLLRETQKSLSCPPYFRLCRGPSVSADI